MRKQQENSALLTIFGVDSEVEEGYLSCDEDPDSSRASSIDDGGAYSFSENLHPRVSQDLLAAAAAAEAADAKLTQQLNRIDDSSDAGTELKRRINELSAQLKFGSIESEYFNTQCLAAIEDARPVLEALGWKTVLANLALAIIGLGVVYAAAGLINLCVTGNFLFFKPTTGLNGIQNATEEYSRSVVVPAGI